MRVLRAIRTNNPGQRFGDNWACSPSSDGVRPDEPVRILPGNYKDGVCPAGSVSFYISVGLKGHNGWDDGAYYGEPCYFPVFADTGWYAKTETDKNGGIGVDVISKSPILLGNRKSHVKFRFWHFKSVAVYDGEEIVPGKLLGYCDSTGRSGGNHLHWSMKWCDKDGNTLERGNGYAGAFDFAPWYENKFILDELNLVAKRDILLKIVGLYRQVILLMQSSRS